MRTRPTVLLSATALVLAGCGPGAGPTDPEVGGTGAGPASPSAPSTSDPGTSEPGGQDTSGPQPTDTGDEPAVDYPLAVAQGLEVPWGLAFLPDGSALVTQRDSAEVVRVGRGEEPRSVGTVPGVQPGGEGGLLGIAVSPDFATDSDVYVYFTAADDNRVLRMTLGEDGLAADQVIVDGIPKGSNHNGGRIAFGPDEYLYIATGDAGDADSSQDLDSLGGKILRVDADGEPAPGNPFPGSPVWTLGHRNVQGIDWDDQGRMWASEFGQSTWDELNLIEPGNNYGWPAVEGQGGSGEFTDPLVQWATSDASPSGIAVGPDDAVYVAALAGQSLWRVPLQQEGVGDPERLLEGELGRLRAVRTGPEDLLWVVTSNTFRGDPQEGDDQVIIVDPAELTG